MADKKISALTAATTPLAGTEVLPIVQGASTVKVSVADLTAGRSFNALGMTLTSTDAGATAAPLLDLYRDSASPAATDTLGEIEFNGEDSAGNKQTYGVIHGSILSPTSTAEQGQLHFETATAGALTEKMIIGTTNLVINEPGGIFNVRIEGDTDANLFYTDATNSRVGIGTSAPSAKLNVAGNTTISGNTDLGAQADSVTAAGYSTRVSGASVTSNGTDWFGSYGECIWNANASATSSARRYSMINGSNYTNMAFMRSVDANTDPALAGNGGTASSGTIDFTWNTDGYFLIGYTASNGGYPLQVNGQIFATNATIATSDGRYKENVAPLSGSLDLIMALKPVQFDWKSHPVHKFDTDIRTVGFIAQEVQEVLIAQPYLNSIIKRNNCVLEPEIFDPETGTVAKAAVTEEFLGISEGNLIALLTNAIQELKTDFDAYKASHP